MTPRPALQIRLATAGDAEAMMALVERVYGEYGFHFDAEEETPDFVRFEDAYHAPDRTCWVGTEHERVVGTIAAAIDAKSMEVSRLYLDAGCRGRGWGRKLLETACAWGRRSNATGVLLWSDTRFERAHRMYEAAGLRDVDVRTLSDTNASTERCFVGDL